LGFLFQAEDIKAIALKECLFLFSFLLAAKRKATQNGQSTDQNWVFHLSPLGSEEFIKLPLTMRVNLSIGRTNSTYLIEF